MATKKETSTEIFVTEQKRETLNFCILGTTPLIHNRMSQKVLQTLYCALRHVKMRLRKRRA
jgi:hypothetical protein